MIPHDTGDDIPPDSDRSRAGWMFSVIWLVYLADPISRLFDHSRPHTATTVAVTLLLAVVFAAAYIGVNVLMRREAGLLAMDAAGDPRKFVLVGVLAVIAAVLPPTVDPEWVVLWIYVASACGVALPLGKPPSPALRGGLAATIAMGAEASSLDVNTGEWLLLLLPCLFSCFGVIAIRGMRDLIRQLREARAEVARLAATEERLRMARDLHDLAGHSLATITLKAELARKLLRVDVDRSEQQILDLEHVSREALADIREAVSGYRRATLAVEASSARTALHAAGIRPDLDPSLPARSGTLDPDAESVLAWCLREAVTNVVRHSGAHSCRIRLIDARVDGEPSLTLEVLDDGPITPDTATTAGNGLNGLRERLRAIAPDAALTAVPVHPRGYRLTATVPIRLDA
ncbi:sensor histidine kinase [Actinospica sp.]|uniref:sensor histidine kinase n=1 Tax=Actinospica sp. TaxID=1872142 RepID=UPI002D03C351|nr:sensor histidine kinase [Actinospica sp.]HWG25416.1 sensor histidine kinase [Actinospica sp.]